MSFSFTLRVVSIVVAGRVAAEEMDKVAAQQPTHLIDRASVLAAVHGQLAHVEKAAEGKHVVLSVSGSLGWQGIAPTNDRLPAEDFAITAAHLNVSAYVIPADATGAHYPPLRT